MSWSALEPNPVDAIWADRPPPPIAPVRLHDESHAGESSAAKRERIAAKLVEKGADVLLLTAADSIAWLLNVRGGDIGFNPLALSYALLNRDGTCRWFVDPRKLPRGLALPNAVAVEPIASFPAALDQIGGASVLVGPGLGACRVPGAIEGGGSEAGRGRRPLRAGEGAEEPGRASGCSRRPAPRWRRSGPLPGMAGSAAARRQSGRGGCRCPTRAGAGGGPAIPWAQLRLRSRRTAPTAPCRITAPRRRVTRKLTGDTLYLIDSGGQYLDATTDITRTVALGTPSAEMRTRFTLVLKGMIAISLAVFPEGTSGAQIDALARVALWRHGLDFDHGTGHGVGSYLCVHEGPARISKLGTVALQPGMILSNEPGYYEPDAYGIRIENLVAVESRPTPEGGNRKLLGFRTLTLCPIDRRLIEPALLTAEERCWLDAYHARVEEELGPLVGEAAGWLRAACRPLA